MSAAIPAPPDQSAPEIVQIIALRFSLLVGKRVLVVMTCAQGYAKKGCRVWVC